MAEYVDINLLGKCDTCRYYVNRKCTTFCDHGESYSPAVSKLPIADVVKVVRCKDCIHREEHPDDNNTYYLTCNLKWGLSGTVAIEDYCSYGKRKELS